jgi:uncharacterized protein
MKLPGIVTNVTAFGAFVDIGVHQDGLVHVSQLADRFVKDPAEVVKVQQRVSVTVLEVDVARKRIALSMRQNPVVAAGGSKTSPNGSVARLQPRPAAARTSPAAAPGAARGDRRPPTDRSNAFNNPFANAFKRKP